MKQYRLLLLGLALCGIASQVYSTPWAPQPIETVIVEGGSFLYDDSATKTTIKVKGFIMGKTEITQNQFAYIMGYNPSWFASRSSAYFPVEDITWYEAVRFCNKLSIRDGFEPVYTIIGEERNPKVSYDFTKNGWRLPTQAEFFYAARGGNKSKNYKWSGSNNIDEVAWYDQNSGGTPHKVATKLPNELGLYDMAGNVWEWSNDFENASGFGWPEKTEDPMGPETGWMRMKLGGAWCHSAYNALAFRQRGYDANDDAFRLGMRVVRKLPDSAN